MLCNGRADAQEQFMVHPASGELNRAEKPVIIKCPAITRYVLESHLPGPLANGGDGFQPRPPLATGPLPFPEYQAITVPLRTRT